MQTKKKIRKEFPGDWRMCVKSTVTYQLGFWINQQILNQPDQIYLLLVILPLILLRAAAAVVAVAETSMIEKVINYLIRYFISATLY